LRSFNIAFSRLRSEGFTVMDIPVRMHQTRTSGWAWESHQDSNVRRDPLAAVTANTGDGQKHFACHCHPR
jgi:hypothetical protein